MLTVEEIREQAWNAYYEAMGQVEKTLAKAKAGEGEAKAPTWQAIEEVVQAVMTYKEAKAQAEKVLAEVLGGAKERAERLKRLSKSVWYPW